jgi:hypothetical protein
LSFYSFVFIIKRDESKKALSVLFATNIKKNKSQFISFLFRPSFGVKRTICFLILLSLPFPPRTAGLNSCCYDAQRFAYATSRGFLRDVAQPERPPGSEAHNLCYLKSHRLVCNILPQSWTAKAIFT